MSYVAGPCKEISSNALVASYSPPACTSVGGQIARDEDIPNIPTGLVTSYASGQDIPWSWNHINVSGDIYQLEAFEGNAWTTVASGIASKSYTRSGWGYRKIANYRVRTSRGGRLSEPSSVTTGKTNAQLLIQDAQGGAGVLDANNQAIVGASIAVKNEFDDTLITVLTSDAGGKASAELDWPKRVYVDFQPNRDHSLPSIFADNFIALSGNWVKLTGSGTASIVDDANAGDGKALRISGPATYEHNQNITLTADFLYRVRIGIRQVSNPSSGGKLFYVGVSGVASDGTTRINTVGADDYASQHYFAASGDSLAVASTFTEYVGYFWYASTTAGAKSPDRESPGYLYPQVAKFRPIFVVNSASGDGVVNIDYLIIEQVTSDEATVTSKNHIVV